MLALTNTNLATLQKFDMIEKKQIQVSESATQIILMLGYEKNIGSKPFNFICKLKVDKF